MEKITNCDIMNKNVKIFYENKYIDDGNSVLPSGSRPMPYDCEIKRCPRYKFCLVNKFIHIKI